MAQLGARFHGMEEVIGSIPIRSTNYFNNLADFPPNVWQQIGSKFQTAVQPSHVSRLYSSLNRHASADFLAKFCSQFTIAAFAATDGGRSLPFAASFFIVPCNSR